MDPRNPPTASEISYLEEPTELDNALLHIKRLERKLEAREQRIAELERRESSAWHHYALRGKEIELLKQHITPYTLKFLGLSDEEGED